MAITSIASAGTITLDFEGFGDSTVLTNQYAGLLFTNASILTAGLSLNDLEFPPHSGTNVAGDTGGPITIALTSPVLTFASFFTYSSSLTISAFDSLNHSVGSANSSFSGNYVSSGHPTNEFLKVSFAGGISRLTITGDPAGSSLFFDDVTVTTPTSAVPEPSAWIMVFMGSLFVFVVGRCRACHS